MSCVPCLRLESGTDAYMKWHDENSLLCNSAVQGVFSGKVGKYSKDHRLVWFHLFG